MLLHPLGVVELKKEQREAIEIFVEGRDVFISFPVTGRATESHIAAFVRPPS